MSTLALTLLLIIAFGTGLVFGVTLMDARGSAKATDKRKDAMEQALREAMDNDK